MNEEINDEIKDVKNQLKEISFAAYEALGAQSERREKRLIGIIALLIVMLALTNAAWLAYEACMTTEAVTTSYDVEQETGDASNFNVIGDGIINEQAKD